MADTNTTLIQALYVAYFGRPADYAGLQYWTDAMAKTTSLSDIAIGFGNSAEYQATYSGMDASALIDTVYEHLFGRHAEAAGIAYWANLLSQNSVTVDDIVAAVAANTQGNDTLVFNAKVETATLFTSHLDQVPERVGYAGASANQLAAAYLATITDAATAAAAEDPANIDALIAKMTNVTQLPGGENVIAHLVGVPDVVPPVHA
jgi:hypothetical protein